MGHGSILDGDNQDRTAGEMSCAGVFRSSNIDLCLEIGPRFVAGE